MEVQRSRLGTLRKLTPEGRQQSKIRALQTLDLFADLGEEDLGALAQKISERRVRRDTVVFYENDPASTMYAIKSGQVKISKISEDGREQILNILSAGELLGPGSALEHRRYPVTATAVVDSELLAIRREDLERMLGEHPEIALKIVGVLLDRLIKAYDLVRDLALQSVPQRTAALLLRLAHEQGRSAPEGTIVTLTISREEMAELIGSARETVIRSLSKFAKAGLIRIEKREIIILDEERLRVWAQM